MKQETIGNMSVKLLNMLKNPLTYLQKDFQACVTILMRGQCDLVPFCVHGHTGFKIHLVI